MSYNNNRAQRFSNLGRILLRAQVQEKIQDKNIDKKIAADNKRKSKKPQQQGK